MVFNLEILPSLTPGGGGGGVRGQAHNPRCHQPSREKGMSGFESTSHDLNEGLVFSMCYSVDLFFYIYVNGYGYRDVKMDAKLQILGHILKSLF